MKISYLLKSLLLLLFLFATGYHAQTTDNEKNVEMKVKNLLSKMTLDEKIGQMQQMFRWNTPTEEELLEAIRAGKVGSFLNAGDKEWKVKLQETAIKESRLGIPLIFARDVIHGYRTMFPIPLGQAASWDTEIVKKGAEVAAREAASVGIHWTFAPMMDIARDPRWGRIAESLGEDPKLASDLAAAMVKGFQGDDLKAEGSIAACAKHFVGYGAAEGGRDYNTTSIHENLLRNVYLRPFHASVDANVATIMSGFNELNGIPVTGNKFVMRSILRNEWDFDGMVVSDWNSMGEMITHGFAEDYMDVAFKSVEAGIDMEMVSESYQDHLKKLVEAGKVDIKLVDECVENILRLKYKIGLFDNPYNNLKAEEELLKEEHLAAAKEAAIKSVVMLKNDNSFLPLSSSYKKIAVIGPLADAPLDQIGTWAPDGKAENSITPLATLKAMFKGKADILYSQGVPEARSESTDLFAEALEAAANSDVVLMFMGEDADLSGESKCRTFLDLPGCQEELIKKVSATGKDIVLVIMAGRPLVFNNITDHVHSILYAWHPGTMGGPALIDIIFGKKAPTGKLPVCFPRTVGQIPVYYSIKSTGRPPSPSQMGRPTGTPENPVDFASYYLDVDYTPKYYFGYGLTYTSFKLSDLKTDKKKFSVSDKLTASVKLTNTGKKKGEEVVQLYIRDLTASVTRPIKELIKYKRVSVDAGKDVIVTFTLTEEDLRFYNFENKFVSEPGKFELYIGNSSNDTDLLKTDFQLVGD